MKILFLTTHNLATNPRLVKEIRMALKEGYKTELICFSFPDHWSNSQNGVLLNSFRDEGVHIIEIGAGREDKWQWAKSVLREKMARSTVSQTSDNEKLANAVSRRSQLIIDALGQIKNRPDLVIGHNPGALYATVVAKNKFGCKAGFDVEDYHPGETNEPAVIKILERYLAACLPQMDYISYASKPIMEATGKLLLAKKPESFVVLNAFDADEFVAPKSDGGKLKLVWFSQNISEGRGLEQFIPLLEKHPEMELHLIGNVLDSFKNKWIEGRGNIFLHPPKPQKELHQFLSGFDVGLALETPHELYNRELSFTNKFMAYLQAGLFILATDTIVQHEMIRDNPGTGMLIKKDFSDAGAKLSLLSAKTKAIRSTALLRFNHGKLFNWQEQSENLQRQWQAQTAMGKASLKSQSPASTPDWQH